jgi:hypothetical protein
MGIWWHFNRLFIMPLPNEYIMEVKKSLLWDGWQERLEAIMVM